MAVLEELRARLCEVEARHEADGRAAAEAFWSALGNPPDTAGPAAAAEKPAPVSPEEAWRWLVNGMGGLTGMFLNVHRYGPPMPANHREKLKGYLDALGKLVQEQETSPRSD